MARPLRIELAGDLYHVSARGDNREPIYFADDDRQAWLEVLGRVCGRFNWRCHAWWQMTNHYHLLVGEFRGRYTGVPSSEDGNQSS